MCRLPGRKDKEIGKRVRKEVRVQLNAEIARVDEIVREKEIKLREFYLFCFFPAISNPPHPPRLNNASPFIFLKGHRGRNKEFRIMSFTIIGNG